MSYQVIARKYRPQRFSDVVGQEHVTQTLSLAVYSAFDVDFNIALAISALLILISAALLITLKWLPSISTSRLRFATSS